MDVAAMSIALNQMKLQQQASTAVLKMAMDSTAGQPEDIAKLLESSTKALEQALQPHLGTTIDMYI